MKEKKTFYSKNKERKLTYLEFRTQFSYSVCPILCYPMDCSTPGFPVHHQLLESTQTHVHWVSDAIQPSHPLSFPSPPAFNFSQHQSLFQWVNSSCQVAKVLELQLYHQSFQWIFRVDFFWNWLVWSPCSRRDSQEYSLVPQFENIFGLQPSFMVQLSHPYMTTGKTITLTTWSFVSKVMSLLFNMLSRLSRFSSKEKAYFNFMAPSVYISE